MACMGVLADATAGRPAGVNRQTTDVNSESSKSSPLAPGLPPCAIISDASHHATPPQCLCKRWANPCTRTLWILQ
eukprot:1645503-Lingulodinium_polyedra.AAC.1